MIEASGGTKCFDGILVSGDPTGVLIGIWANQGWKSGCDQWANRWRGRAGRAT